MISNRTYVDAKHRPFKSSTSLATKGSSFNVGDWLGYAAAAGSVYSSIFGDDDSPSPPDYSEDNALTLSKAFSNNVRLKEHYSPTLAKEYDTLANFAKFSRRAIKEAKRDDRRADRVDVPYSRRPL